MVIFLSSIFVHLQKKIAQQNFFWPNRIIFCQMLNKPLKLAPKTVKISRSGEISANLVTLQTSVLIDFDRQLNPDLREMFVFGCRRRRQQQKVAQN